MDPEQFMKNYERRLSKHCWDAVDDLIHYEAIFIFTEGTFRGKSEIGDAFTGTFRTIQDKQYN